MKRILLAEDHAVVRRGVIDILSNFSPSVLVDETENIQTALKALRSTFYELLILDISFPDGNGLALYQQAKEISPRTKCLFLTMHPEERYARRVFKVGAHGYITKDRAADELLEAVRVILSGGKFITNSLAKLLIDELNMDAVVPHETLSNREYQIALAIADGKTITEIAQILALSPKTISTYRHRVLTKLGLSSTAELIRYVLENDLA